MPKFKSNDGFALNSKTIGQQERFTEGSFNEEQTSLLKTPFNKGTALLKGDKIKTVELDEVVMYPKNRLKKRYQPSEVGGNNAKNSKKNPGKAFVVKKGDPVI